MRMSTQVKSGVDPFDGAREMFERTVAELRERAAGSHTDVIGTLRERGAEVERRLLQGWLDHLFEIERAETALWPRAPGSEVRARKRGLETDFGRVTVARHGMRLAGEKEAKFPMDGILNLPREIYALSLRERIADEAASESFDAAVQSLDRNTAGHVPKRQSEELVVRGATDFEEFYEERIPPANDTLSAQGLQVMSTDCKGVTMRPEALREATRKEAEAAKADAGRGDPMAARKARRSDKRMAVVTAVWEQEVHKRAAKDVLERLGRDPNGRKRRPRSKKAPKPQNKRVSASVTKSLADGVAEMFDEAHRRNPTGERRNVVLLDGDDKQKEYVQAEATKRGMSITVVLDLIHVIHYLWTIAMLLCGGVQKEAEAWTNHILEQLLTRHPLDVIATIRQTATNRKLTAADRAAVDNAVGYLDKNSLYIHYAQFLKEGLPIATGVIEGACRYLVQDRMGITGARWGLAVAEAVLKLRAIRTSGDWEQYWRFHLKKEHERNYPKAWAA